MKRAELEDGLKTIAGVRDVRVVGDEQPTEIHVVVGTDRAPKQVVRDVQSLAAAGFGISLDHRIISVVQIDPPATNGAGPARVLIERIEVSKGMDSEWVKVALRQVDGQPSEGSCTGGASRQSRGKAAVIAAIRALEPALAPRNARVDLESLVISRIDPHDTVCVRVEFYESSVPTSLIGTAAIEDDVATAAIKALLQALNRKLS